MNSIQDQVTTTNKKLLLLALTWLLMIVATLATLARNLTKLFTTRRLGLDDFLANTSTVAAIIQSVNVLMQCSNGLGKYRSLLDHEQQSNILKFEYASALMFIVSLLLAKLSIIQTIKDIAHFRYNQILLVLRVFTTAWAISGFAVIAFQCKLPFPWDYTNGQCVHLVAFWTCFSIMNILSDLCITGLVAYLVQDLQTTRSKKAVVLGVFSSRLLVTPAIVCQVYYTTAYLTPVGNFTFDRWQAVAAVQVVQCLSIVTTCVPFLKRFLDSLESGGMRVGEPHASGDERRCSANGGWGCNALASEMILCSISPHHSGDWQGLVDSSPNQYPARIRDKVLLSERSNARNSQGILQTKTWNVELEEGGKGSIVIR